MVEKVSLGIFAGKSDVTGASVASPQGGNFIDVGSVTVDADIWTLAKPYLHFEDLDLSNLNITINELPNGETNAAHVITHLSNYIKAQKATKIGRQISKEIEGYLANKKIVVDRILLTGIQFNVDLPMISKGKGPVPFRINNVVISDIGKQQQGVYYYELLAILLQALMNSLLQTVPSELSNVLRARLVVAFENALDYKGVMADVGQGLTNIGKSIGWVTSSISNATENAGDAVAGAINTAVANTENAITKPFNKAVNAITPSSETKAAKEAETKFKKFVDKPFKVFRTWADNIQNATDTASNAVSGAGDQASGKVLGVGQTVGQGRFTRLLTQV